MDSTIRRTWLYRFPLFLALLFVTASVPASAATTLPPTETTVTAVSPAAGSNPWKAYWRPWGWLCEDACTPGWCCFWVGGDA